jgi:hypothetical protein
LGFSEGTSSLAFSMYRSSRPWPFNLGSKRMLSWHPRASKIWSRHNQTLLKSCMNAKDLHDKAEYD